MDRNGKVIIKETYIELTLRLRPRSNLLGLRLKFESSKKSLETPDL